MQILRLAAGLAAVALIASLASCGKDEQEAGKFGRADNYNFVRDMSDMSSFTLENGITVYIQEERTIDQVAVEVIYPAGFVDEPAGQAQLSHVAEHLAIHCASGSFKAEESFEKIAQIKGMINAEAVSDFSHVDYIAPGASLGDVLAIEAQRLISVQCDEAVRKREVTKVISEIDLTVSGPTGSLAKYGLMALNQAVYHGAKFVPIRDGANRITIDQVHEFLQTHYRPDDAVIVIIGNVKKDEAEALVRKHFAGIPRRPAPVLQRSLLKTNLKASWDIDGQVLYFVSPGPYDSFRERLVLTMFGSYLHQVLMTTEEVYAPCRSVYASNQVYRVADIPFFVFAEPAKGRTIDEVRPIVRRYIEASASTLDDARIEAITGGAVAFVTTSSLKKNVPDYPLAHHQVIGQEALNVGMKHLLREGRSADEFVAEVKSISADEFRAIVQKYVNPSRLVEVTFTPRR